MAGGTPSHAVRTRLHSITFQLLSSAAFARDDLRTDPASFRHRYRTKEARRVVDREMKRMGPENFRGCPAKDQDLEVLENIATGDSVSDAARLAQLDVGMY